MSNSIIEAQITLKEEQDKLKEYLIHIGDQVIFISRKDLNKHQGYFYRVDSIYKDIAVVRRVTNIARNKLIVEVPLEVLELAFKPYK